MFLLDWKEAKSQCSFFTKITTSKNWRSNVRPNHPSTFKSWKAISCWENCQPTLSPNLWNEYRCDCLLDHDCLCSQIWLKTIFSHLFPAPTLLETPKWCLNIWEMRRIDRDSAGIDLCWDSESSTEIWSIDRGFIFRCQFCAPDWLPIITHKRGQS